MRASSNDTLMNAWCVNHFMTSICLHIFLLDKISERSFKICRICFVTSEIIHDWNYDNDVYIYGILKWLGPQHAQPFETENNSYVYICKAEVYDGTCTNISRY